MAFRAIINICFHFYGLVPIMAITCINVFLGFRRVEYRPLNLYKFSFGGVCPYLKAS